MKKEEILAWKIYRKDFVDGRDVVVEDFDGAFYFGKLKTIEDGIELTRPNGRKTKFIAWEDIVFLADGDFPVSEIKNMTYHEAIVRASYNNTKCIRSFLIKEAEDNKEKMRPKEPKSSRSVFITSYYERPTRRTFGGGCPFVFEDVIITDLFNAGNNSWNHWGEDNEELLRLESKDGAVMHSFDLSHLFVFDGLKLAG